MWVGGQEASMWWDLSQRQPGGGGRQQCQELKPWKDAGFDKEEVLQNCREYIPARPHLHLLWSMLGSCAPCRWSEVLYKSLVLSVHDQLGQEIVLGHVRKDNSTCLSCSGLGSAEHVSADCFRESRFYTQCKYNPHGPGHTGGGRFLRAADSPGSDFTS